MAADGVQQCLSLQWCFGLNKDFKGVVHNLSDGARKRVLYCIGHTAVIYEVEEHKQKLLQGHRNSIVASCVSTDRRFVATCDAGVDALMIVWDTHTCLPIKHVSLDDSEGVLAMDMTPDAMYIATLSKDEPQSISLWEWTAEDGDRPKLKCGVAAKDLQTCIRFNTNDNHLIITNGERRVVFWSWLEGALKYYSPAVSSRDFKQQVGSFTQSVFLPDTDLAASGTVDGDVVLWGGVTSEKKTKATDKVVLKVVRVHSTGVTFLSAVGGLLVTGGVEGYVRFFDHQLRTVAWFEELNGGPVISVSFDKSPVKGTGGAGTFTGQEFLAPDFVASTANAMIIDVKSHSFNTANAELQRGQLLVQGQDQPIMAVAAHPFLPRIAIAGYSGNLHLWEYTTRRVLLLSIFRNLLTHCLAFDPKAAYLAAGFTNGVVKILDASSLEELQSFRPKSADCVTMITFSHDSQFFAAADAEGCVGVYKFTHRAQDPRKPIEWVYMGRHRAHRAPITGLQFGIVPYGDTARLISVGEDKRLIEYNLVDTDIETGLRVKSAHKISQGAVPTGFLWASVPLVEDNERGTNAPDALVISTNEYKVKLFSTDASRLCTKTVLSPTYGGPLHTLLVVPGEGKQAECLVYSTHERVVGLIKFPLNGNPRSAMGLLAHPVEVSSVAVSFDGKYLFSAGGRDCCVNQWSINCNALSQEDGRPVVDHYIDTIEGGKEGEFMKEIIDYFYYAQIRSQGEETTAKRTIEGTIPFTQVPNLMRALGYYPSEKEIQNMTFEIYTKYGKLMGTDEIFIDFETFLKLYVNHRPVFGINKSNIEAAFAAIGADPVSGVIDRDTLFGMLRSKAEALHQLEVESCLRSLLGDDVTRVDLLEDKITAKAFAETLLGFEDYDTAGDEEEEEDEEMDDDETRSPQNSM
ncbi:77 kDa echinoderm microtubule-associated protein [Diplonema papillatum]|nr:77 kDa echinoderm microtubule-associated protein [Diplonema papillatum]